MSFLITQKLKLNDVCEGKILNGIKNKLKVDADSELIRKGLEPSDLKFEDNERASIEYITTKKPDRDREIVLPQGGDLLQYKKNPVVLWCHKNDQLPVGRNMWIKTDTNGLIAKTQYSKDEFANRVFNYLKEGFPLANSIGFIPKIIIEKSEFNQINIEGLGLVADDLRNTDRIYHNWYMLEYSKVPVPANPDAYQLAISKGLDIPKTSYYFISEEDLANMKNIEWEVTKINNNEKNIDEYVVDDSTSDIPETVIVNDMNSDNNGECSSCKLDLSESKGDKRENEVFEYCKCKSCGYTEKSKGDCKDIKCPKCGGVMIGNNVDKDDNDNAKEGQKQEPEEQKNTKPGWDENDTSFRYRVREPSLFQEGSFRTVPIKKDKPRVNSVMGKLKNEINMTVQSLIFPKDDNWDMNKAKAWLSEHSDLTKSNKEKVEKINFKERINKQLPESFNRKFNIELFPSEPNCTLNEIYCKYLECQIKDVYLNSYLIPAPLIGTYLSAIKYILNDDQKFVLKSERNFEWNGKEKPLIYDTIKLNSKASEDFLIMGNRFYGDQKSNVKFIINFEPGWRGESVEIVTNITNREYNKSLFNRIHQYADDNNLLKNENFSITGEFIENSSDDWDDLIVDKKIKESLLRNIKKVKNNSSVSRGLLFIGTPGNGKTLTGKVLINNNCDDYTFIWGSSKDFTDLGSARALGIGFDLARKLSPSIFFLEDIDSWIGYNIDLLKTELDGIKKNNSVLTILTSNFPEKLPDALLDRPGRFHEILEFKNPDKDIRKQMIAEWIGEIKEEVINQIVDELDGYSGAHIKELCNYAWDISMNDNEEIEKALLLSVNKIKAQHELIAEIKKENYKDVNEDFIIKSLKVKSGRVISGKNLSKIKSAYEALAEVIKIADREISNDPQLEDNEAKSKNELSEKDLEYLVTNTNQNNQDNSNNKSISISEDTLKDLLDELVSLTNKQQEKEQIENKDQDLDISIDDINKSVSSTIEHAFNKFNQEVSEVKKKVYGDMEIRLAKATGRVTL